MLLSIECGVVRDPGGDRAGEHRHSGQVGERRKAEIELELANSSWSDPRRGQIRFSVWAREWVNSRHDLRLTTRARLEASMASQVLPKFGTTPLVKISNGAVRAWVAEMLDQGLSPATVREAVFALRQCLAAAMADNRLVLNPAEDVPLLSTAEASAVLSQSEVERLADEMPDRYRAMVLVGAYAGLRWGEAARLTRRNVDILRSRIRVISTAVEVRGHVTLGQEPKTRRSRRTVPVVRSVMRQLEAHMAAFVAPEPDALVFTAPHGGPLRRSLFSRRVWRPAAQRAGHNNVVFTLTRYGGLFEDGSDEAVGRLDALLSGSADAPERVIPLQRGERL